MSDVEVEGSKLARSFKSFAETNTGSALALHDLDADGLAAGVIWQRCLERLGRKDVRRLILRRDRNVWFGGYDETLAATSAESLYVLDLGCQTRTLIEGVPTCVIDHHRPEPPAEGTLLLTSYAWKPTPAPTAWLMYRLASEVVDVGDLDWVAVVGTEGDLGPKAPFALMESVKGKYRRKDLSETIALVNAIRRSSDQRPELAAEALLTHESPRALVESKADCVEALRQAREEVREEMLKAKMAAPRFAGQVALVEVDSACQVHPVIAQIWRGRLKKYYVIAANVGYLPGKVNFSARSNEPLKVLQFLRGLPEYSNGCGFGEGHDHASGGSLSFEDWHRLLERLGFTDPPAQAKAAT